jgi:fermentation-respiration switch protein FrsA (DUF1100 family)
MAPRPTAPEAGPAPAAVRRRLLLIAIGLFAPILLIWFGTAFIVAHGLQFPPALPYSTSGKTELNKTAAADARPLAELIDASSDEITLEQDGPRALRGLLAPAVPAKSAVILTYPNRVDEQSLAPYFRAASSAGYPVLTIDYPDAAARSGFGWKQRRDVVKAIAALRSRGVQRVAVIGVSEGAAAALFAGADGAALSAIISDSSYAELRSLLRRIPPLDSLNPLFDQSILWALGFRMGRRVGDLSPAEAAAKLGNCPLLVINGADDPLVPVADARRIFASASGPKALWIVPGAGHAAALAVQPDQYTRRVGAFLTRYLGSPPG